MKFLSELILMDGENSFLLQKRIALLGAIDKVGSLSAAAKMVPLSYKGAWDMIDAMNNFCPSPVVQKATGGVGGGGTTLTQYGKNLVKTYEVIYQEHQKFLETISHVTDFDSGSLKFFRRFNMQISARNQIVATVVEIKIDKVNATLHMKLKSGYIMTSVITAGAVENLGLKLGDEVIVIFKSNSVLLSSDLDVKLSAMNKLSGIVEKIYFSEINCEVVVNVGGDYIASVVTKGAIEALNIKVGDSVVAIIKSSDVMVGK